MMQIARSYYSESISRFLNQSEDEIYGIINKNSPAAETTLQQKNAWMCQINILKNQLSDFEEGKILFEYTIPRMGKRVDNIILYKNIVFLLEFKCWDDEYAKHTIDQVCDYALDLQNFQKESSDKLLVPIIIPTDAPSVNNEIVCDDNIVDVLKCNKSNIGSIIKKVVSQFPNQQSFDYDAWENADYLPTPTIIEAAQALYSNHSVEEITRHDANIDVTTEVIDKIITHSKNNKRKSICFVTGVPGAGKTLVGLDIAVKHAGADTEERAVFLSGNAPLVDVLQEALARDRINQIVARGGKATKKVELSKTSAFIQIIHRYRDFYVGNDTKPPEHVVIFDEAQRAWTHEAIAVFMNKKKGIHEFQYSEPEFLIQTMDRHEDWATIICLIGGGQEINTGEAGLSEWFDSIRRSFKNWDVYVAPQLNDTEYCRDRSWNSIIEGINVKECPGLHLSTEVRSFRTPHVAAFVKALLDIDVVNAQALYKTIRPKYPLVITRDLNTAKEWVKKHSKGTTRYGIIASSKGLRLKPEGLFVKSNNSIVNWILGDKNDVRSSYYMEEVATEFDIQGLEIDYTVVAWDADLRFNGTTWVYKDFVGSSWNNINKEEDRLYLKNAYRVLLTRARQGVVIFVPKGSDEDETRQRIFYDKTYDYLCSLGIEKI